MLVPNIVIEMRFVFVLTPFTGRVGGGIEKEHCNSYI